MRRDFRLAIILTAAAIPYGAAMMAAPSYFQLSPTAAALFFWGGMIGTIALIGIAVAIAIRDEEAARQRGQKRPMLAIVGMVVFGLAFLGCAAWYFWPTTDDPITWDLKNITPGHITTEGVHYIHMLAFRGVQSSQTFAHLTEAKVESRVTGETINLKVRTQGGYILPSQTNPIPPGAKIELEGLLYDPSRMTPGQENGIRADEFYRRWSSFIFVDTIDGHNFTHSFSPKDVNAILDAANPRPVIQPTVTGNTDAAKVEQTQAAAAQLTLLDLFMSDFTKGTGAGAYVERSIGINLRGPNNQKTFILCKLVEDFGNNAKFFVIYVPHTDGADGAMTFFAESYKNYLTPQPIVETTTVGEGKTSSTDMTFTGRVFVYYEDFLTHAQLAQVGATYKNNGLQPEFRGQTYLSVVRGQIGAGKLSPPTKHYEMRGGIPVETEPPR